MVAIKNYIMDDLAIIGNKTESFLVFHRNVLNEIFVYLQKFTNLLPMVDINVASHTEFYNWIANHKFQVYFQEEVYYVDKKKFLKDNVTVYDLSGSLDPTNTTLHDDRVIAVTADNFHSYFTLCQNPKRDIYVRLSVTNDFADFGCSIKELRMIFGSPMIRSHSIAGLCVNCFEKKTVGDCINMLEEAIQIAKEYDINITSIIFIGPGICQLASDEAPQSEATFEKLLSFATKYSVMFDASLLFSNLYTIYTKVINMKERHKDDEHTNIYYTDNGIYTSFYNKRIRNEGYNPIPISTHGDDFSTAELHKSIIFGPTCDSVDCLGKDFRLPRMQINDWFKFEGCGYKCRGYATGFNGLHDFDVITLE